MRSKKKLALYTDVFLKIKDTVGFLFIYFYFLHIGMNHCAD